MSDPGLSDRPVSEKDIPYWIDRVLIPFIRKLRARLDNSPVMEKSLLAFPRFEGAVSIEAYTAPGTGINRFVGSLVKVRLKTAIVGDGTVTITSGLTAGGTDFLLAAVWDKNTPVGTEIGVAVADLGAAFSARYLMDMDGGESVFVQAETSAAGISFGTADVLVCGWAS